MRVKTASLVGAVLRALIYGRLECTMYDHAIHTDKMSFLPSLARLAVEHTTRRRRILLHGALPEAKEHRKINTLSVVLDADAISVHMHRMRIGVGTGGEVDTGQPDTIDPNADSTHTIGKQELEQRPPILIEAGGYDPRDEAYSFEELRDGLQNHIDLFTAIMMKSRGTRRGQEESDAAEPGDGGVDPESVLNATQDMTSVVEEVLRTLDDLLLSAAYHVYFYNGVYRDQVRNEDGDPDIDELYLRWEEGKIGRNKNHTRVSPLKSKVDRAAVGWMGNLPVEDKSEMHTLIVDVYEALAELGGVMESNVNRFLIDDLVKFSDSIFDIHHWALHQEDPTPLLTDGEKTELNLLTIMLLETEAISLEKARNNGTLDATKSKRLEILTTELIPGAILRNRLH